MGLYYQYYIFHNPRQRLPKNSRYSPTTGALFCDKCSTWSFHEISERYLSGIMRNRKYLGNSQLLNEEEFSLRITQTHEVLAKLDVDIKEPRP